MHAVLTQIGNLSTDRPLRAGNGLSESKKASKIEVLASLLRRLKSKTANSVFPFNDAKSWCAHGGLSKFNLVVWRIAVGRAPRVASLKGLVR